MAQRRPRILIGLGLTLRIGLGAGLTFRIGLGAGLTFLIGLGLTFRIGLEGRDGLLGLDGREGLLVAVIVRRGLLGLPVVVIIRRGLIGLPVVVIVGRGLLGLLVVVIVGREGLLGLLTGVEPPVMGPVRALWSLLDIPMPIIPRMPIIPPMPPPAPMRSIMIFMRIALRSSEPLGNILSFMRSLMIFIPSIPPIGFPGLPSPGLSGLLGPPGLTG